MPQIRDMRARADADRPYLIAIQDVLAEWRDAEERVRRRARPSSVGTRPFRSRSRGAADADPDDIASARSEVKLCEMFVPATPPAERFMPALTAAMQARADAAGGPDKIVSGDDVDRPADRSTHRRRADPARRAGRASTHRP